MGYFKKLSFILTEVIVKNNFGNVHNKQFSTSKFIKIGHRHEINLNEGHNIKYHVNANNVV